ncbi:T9SS type A sorting domain-containing protein [Chitinophagaceae bacterium MMS25-I14]
MKKNVPVIKWLCNSLLAALCILSTHQAYSQSWQWGRRGGSAYTGTNTYPYEAIKDMATDSHGNVYFLAVAESSGSPDLNGAALSGFGGRDILLASFNCSGSLRWRKMIGSYTDDVPVALRTDASGHVYVTGIIHAQNPYPAHFGTDTTLPVSNEKALFIAQYDTSGNLGWLREPQPDTTGINSTYLYKSYDLALDQSGNIYMLAYLYPGLLSGGNNIVVNSAGAYILKYNAQGNLLQLLQPPMNWVLTTNGNSTNITINLICTPGGNFIVSGNVNFGYPPVYSFTLGGQVQTQSGFIAGFNTQGQLLWHHHSDSAGFGCRPVTDGQNGVYFAGGGINGAIFNGYTISNSVSSLTYIVPMVMKTDTSGNLIWAKNGSSNANAGADALTLRGGEVAVAGEFPGKLVWDTKKVENVPNQGYDIFLAHLDKQTGAMQGFDSLKSNFGVNDYPTAITSDNAGNLYLGGRFAGDLYVGSQTLINSGGDFDFFVAKYGYPCNCTAPVSAYTSSLSNHTVNLTYNGTTPVDSVRWSFGDGNAATGLTVNHTYTSAGSYSVCATAYSQCGTDDSCRMIQVAAAVAGVSLPDDVRVYPNPVKDRLTIEADKKYEITLFDALGREMLREKINTHSTTIGLQQFPAGIYLLQFTGDTGRKGMTRIVKE